MEGLIPFVYKAIMQYKNGGGGGGRQVWFNDSPSPPPYMRLSAGDSGRFQVSDVSLFGSDYGFPTSTTSSNSMNSSSSSQLAVSAGGQSPLVRLNPRRI